MLFDFPFSLNSINHQFVHKCFICQDKTKTVRLSRTNVRQNPANYTSFIFCWKSFDLISLGFFKNVWSFSFNRSYTSYFQYIVSAYCKNQLWGRHCNELNITMGCIAMYCISIEELINIKKKITFRWGYNISYNCECKVYQGFILGFSQNF